MAVSALRRLLLGGTVALAALALTGCGIVQDAIEQATGGSSTDTASEVSGTGEDTDIFAITVGDCLNDGDSSGEVQSAPTVACSDPHDSEAYASVMVADGEFPGEDAIAAQAENDCYAGFAPFVGTTYEESAYAFTWYYPTELSWADGDREILCMLYDPEFQPITGSLQGAAR
jgi:hypothetical protein